MEQREPIGHAKGLKGRGADAHQAQCGQRCRSRAMGNVDLLRGREVKELLWHPCVCMWSGLGVEGLEKSSEIFLSKINILKIPRGKTC